MRGHQLPVCCPGAPLPPRAPTPSCVVASALHGMPPPGVPNLPAQMRACHHCCRPDRAHRAGGHALLHLLLCAGGRARAGAAGARDHRGTHQGWVGGWVGGRAAGLGGCLPRWGCAPWRPTASSGRAHAPRLLLKPTPHTAPCPLLPPALACMRAGRAVSLAMVAHWVCNFAVGQLFLSAVAAVGVPGVYLFFAAACFACVAFASKAVVETKGRRCVCACVCIVCCGMLSLTALPGCPVTPSAPPARSPARPAPPCPAAWRRLSWPWRCERRGRHACAPAAVSCERARSAVDKGGGMAPQRTSLDCTRLNFSRTC